MTFGTQALISKTWSAALYTTPTQIIIWRFAYSQELVIFCFCVVTKKQYRLLFGIWCFRNGNKCLVYPPHKIVTSMNLMFTLVPKCTCFNRLWRVMTCLFFVLRYLTLILIDCGFRSYDRYFMYFKTRTFDLSSRSCFIIVPHASKHANTLGHIILTLSQFIIALSHIYIYIQCAL